MNIGSEFDSIMNDTFCDASFSQMLPLERRTLYKSIRLYKPGVVLEIGTYYGSGSTFMISSALAENKHGKLITVEIDKNVHRAAIQRYSDNKLHLMKYIDFLLGDSREVIREYIFEPVDFVVIDGGSGDVPLHEMHLLEKRIANGGHVFVHDWNTAKTEKLRPYFDNNPLWEIVEQVGYKDHNVYYEEFKIKPGGIFLECPGAIIFKKLKIDD
jgi:predicted O-methyltransferase YrrM